MSRAFFNDLLLRWPVLAYAMVNILSERLDATNNASFRDLTQKNHALQKAYDELKAAQAQLIEKERLERELKVAAEIQISILPDVLPRAPGFDFGARILPARSVGGDFYDVFRLDEIPDRRRDRRRGRQRHTGGAFHGPGACPDHGRGGRQHVPGRCPAVRQRAHHPAAEIGAIRHRSCTAH